MTVWNKRYALDIMLGSLILIIPFILSLHLLVDDTRGITVWHFVGIEIKHRLAHNRIWVWSILVRLIPIMLLSLWFLITRNWWRYFIILALLPFATSLIPYIYYGSLLIYYQVISIIVFSFILKVFHSWINAHYYNERLFDKSLINLISNRFKRIFYNLKDYREYNQTFHNGTRGNLIKQLYLFSTLSKLRKTYPSELHLINRIALVGILLTLSLIPFIYYSYQLIPEQKETIQFGTLKLGSFGFIDIRSFLLYFNLKLCILIPLCIWFITSLDWWRYALLSPIILYTYQLWEAVQYDVIWVDESEYIRAFPFILILITLLITLSKSIRYQAKIMDMHDEVCEQIETLLEQFGNLDHLTQNNILKFNKLKAKRSAEGSDKVHLEALHKFKEELLSDLENTNFQLQERDKAWKAL